MERDMKNRWIALYVENQVGVLAKVSGLFSGKSYNLQSLTVGTTEDETISRMTICVTSDDITFEQIKKQLNRMVEVISKKMYGRGKSGGISDRTGISGTGSRYRKGQCPFRV